MTRFEFVVFSCVRCSYYVNSPIEESFWIRILMFVVMIGLIVALILQAQQTEVTSRLDFLWKLQATGESRRRPLVIRYNYRVACMQ